MPSYAQRKVASYRHVQRATTTPAQRLVMCYDAVVRDLEKALVAFDDPSPNRLADVHNALHHAHQILVELQLALDDQAAPDLCTSLRDLYDFWLSQLSEANVRKDPAPVAAILDMVRDMRDTWQQAARQAPSSF
jgi:flagellar protein FliS